MTAGRAAVLETGELLVSDVEFADPGPGEVLVKLVASGMCHTDLGVIAGGIPFPSPGIIGHEGAGIVERVGEGVTDLAAGDKVLLSFTSCGSCAVGGMARLTHRARTARGEAQQHLVALGEARHALADTFDDAGALVTDDPG